MKKFLILILICVIQNTFSQSTKTNIPNDDTLYNTAGIDIQPEFPGGKPALDNFLKQNYQNPNDTKLKGNVYVTFIIEKDGSLSDIKVLRDIGSGSGAEAIRVLKMSPKWIPGKQNNNIVRTLFSLPIPVNNFVLK